MLRPFTALPLLLLAACLRAPPDDSKPPDSAEPDADADTDADVVHYSGEILSYFSISRLSAEGSCVGVLDLSIDAGNGAVTGSGQCLWEEQLLTAIGDLDVSVEGTNTTDDDYWGTMVFTFADEKSGMTVDWGGTLTEAGLEASWYDTAQIKVAAVDVDVNVDGLFIVVLEQL